MYACMYLCMYGLSMSNLKVNECIVQCIIKESEVAGVWHSGASGPKLDEADQFGWSRQILIEEEKEVEP